MDLSKTPFRENVEKKLYFRIDFWIFFFGGAFFDDFSCFSDTAFCIDFRSTFFWKMVPNCLQNLTVRPPFWHKKSTLAPKPIFDWIWMAFWLLWAPFGLPFGSLLLPFASLLLPLGSLWVHFGSFWLPFGSLLLPFGRFGSLLAPLRLHFTTFRPSECKNSSKMLFCTAPEAPACSLL